MTAAIAFVAGVDSPVGFAVSRLLSQTLVGSKLAPVEELEDETTKQSNINTEKKEGAKEPYKVVGTLSTPPVDIITALNCEPPATLSKNALQLAAIGHVHLPGDYIETGNRKKDMAKKDAIERFSVTGKKPKWVESTVSNSDLEALKATILTADVIVYDIIQNLQQAKWVIEWLEKEADTFTKPKTFIAVSSVLTWAKTKVESEDGDISLTEDEYRRRKPHPNFKDHIAVEKEVIKAGKKENLRTYVVCAGLLYHAGDCVFHHLLKAAWHNEEKLVVYGEGSNVLPTIYVEDLANIVVEVADTRPEPKYVLAVDDSKNTLYEITKAVSETMGTGLIKKLSKESALLNRELSQTDYDMLMMNLRLDAGFAKEMQFEWRYESGLVENLANIAQEYKDARGLAPLRIVVHGPPNVGKTFYAKKLAEKYELHYVMADSIMEEAVKKLESVSKDDDDVDAKKELLAELKEAAKANNGRYPDDQMITFLRDKLRSMPCRNQGYVLDGYPTTVALAKELFRPSSEEEEGGVIDESMSPDYVFSLESTDEFIKEQAMKLSEAAASGTSYAEDVLLKRLEEFRTNNKDENTVLNFFDEVEIHPVSISITSLSETVIMNQLETIIGRPHNYGPTIELLLEQKKLAAEAKAKEDQVNAEKLARLEKEEAERRLKDFSEWEYKLEEVRKQEQEVLEAQSVPLRGYLMKYVMPTLTSGLIEVCKVRPDDPIDFLAEFLFKQNPNDAV